MKFNSLMTIEQFYKSFLLFKVQIAAQHAPVPFGIFHFQPSLKILSRCLHSQHNFHIQQRHKDNTLKFITHQKISHKKDNFCA